MAVPWLQIVNLMPTILDVSRELLKRTRKLPAPGADPEGKIEDDPIAGLHPRIRRLEENERRQAELITAMADQLSQLTAAAAALHKITRWLIVGQAVTAVLAIAAIVMALR